VLLCVIYVLGPYISNVVIGDPVRGQVLISGWHANAGYIVAVTAPFLGAAADRMGRRKPLLAAVVAALATATLVQWFARPAAEGLPIWAVGAAVTAAGVAFAWSEVLHNSMLTRAALPAQVSYVSGLGLALGNASSVLLLVFVLWAWALPGQLDLPFLPDAPLFGLDPAAHEPSRIVAPLCAAWLLLFAAPLFLYTPDLDTTGEKLGVAMARGFGNVLRTLRKLRDYRNIAIFLLARMFYSDGKTAILIFGGVYASGVMGWGLVEMLTFGVILTVFAVAGGLAGGWLDSAVGPKIAVVIEIGVTLVCLVVMVSMSADRMLFFIPVEAGATVWPGAVFDTAPELAYLAASMVIAVSITAAYASSRTLMARLAPKGMEGELFGLYALSGAATVWLGPMLVERFTEAYQSQRAGFAAIALLLVIGFALLLWVKPPARDSGLGTRDSR
jgi:UMF1 family MFS transporter